MKAALYARVSTNDQFVESQLVETRRYAEARGWPVVEYVDQAVSGTRESRPALDRLVKDAKRRRFDVLVVWRLDRLGRSLKHLVTLLDEFHSLGVDFVSLGEGIDATTPAGKLQMHVLAAIAEFERGRIVERVKAGIARARAKGTRLGRPKAQVPVERVAAVAHLAVAEAARVLGVSRSTLKRWRKGVQKTPVSAASVSPRIGPDSRPAEAAA